MESDSDTPEKLPVVIESPKGMILIKAFADEDTMVKIKKIGLGNTSSISSL